MLAQVGLYSCEGLDLKFAFRRFDFLLLFERLGSLHSLI